MGYLHGINDAIKVTLFDVINTVVEPVLLEDILVPTDDEDSREVVQCGLDEIVQELHNHLEEIHVQRIRVIEGV
nr:hypothetical protein [Tanacetum cinerariifolium]